MHFLTRDGTILISFLAHFVSFCFVFLHGMVDLHFKHLRTICVLTF